MFSTILDGQVLQKARRTKNEKEATAIAWHLQRMSRKESVHDEVFV